MQVMNSIGKTYAGISDADTKKGFLSSLVDAKSFFLHSFVGDTVSRETIAYQVDYQIGFAHCNNNI
jgi:hypothetical protein